MSADQPTVPDRGLPDERLLRELEAFGMTLERNSLEHNSGGPIRSRGSDDVEILPTPAVESETPSPRPPWLGWPLAIAAAILIAALAGLALFDRIAETDSTDIEPVNESESNENSADGDLISDRTETDLGVDDQVFVPVGPTALVAADGSPLATVDLSGPNGDPAITMDPSSDPDQRPYVELAVQSLLDDTDRLIDIGWSADLVDESADPVPPPQWLAQSGLTVTTNLDLELLEQAREAVLISLSEMYDADRASSIESFDYDTVVTTMNPETGALSVFLSWPDSDLFWVDERSDSDRSGAVYPSSPLNPEAGHCCLRAPGSAFKPIVLATAFDQGYVAEDLIAANGPCQFTDPTVANGTYRVGGSSGEPRSLAAVTRSSNNCAYVRLGAVAGNDQVATTAAEMGLTTLLDTAGDWLSLPLGPAEVDWIEMTGAYGALAADGIRHRPETIFSVTSADGGAVWLHEPSGEAVLELAAAQSVNQVLESVVESGTGRNAQIEGHHIAGKTGTTENFADAWFIGYSRHHVTTVWLGDTDPDLSGPRPIRLPGWDRMFGGGLPAEIWQAYMEPVHQSLQPIPFDPPPPVDRDPVMLTTDLEVDE